MGLTPQESADIREFIADCAEKAKTAVKGGKQCKATVILRAPHLPDGDVIVTEDAPASILAAIRRKFPEADRCIPGSPGGGVGAFRSPKREAQAVHVALVEIVQAVLHQLTSGEASDAIGLCEGAVASDLRWCRDALRRALETPPADQGGQP